MGSFGQNATMQSSQETSQDKQVEQAKLVSFTEHMLFQSANYPGPNLMPWRVFESFILFVLFCFLIFLKENIDAYSSSVIHNDIVTFDICE